MSEYNFCNEAPRDVNAASNSNKELEQNKPDQILDALGSFKADFKANFTNAKTEVTSRLDGMAATLQDMKRELQESNK